MEPEKDLLGRPLEESERELLALHRQLEALAKREDLAPCVHANLRHMLAASWQIVTDLDLAYEPGTLGERA
jgi:hypothetical protein